MKNFFLVIITFFIGCSEQNENSCSVPATVRDLTGLDGCGFVLELEDGSRLEPIFDKGLLKNETDTSGFQLIDGTKVFISYETAKEGVSICMVGPIVKITCIREANITED